MLLVSMIDEHHPNSKYTQEGFLARIFLHGLAVTALITLTVFLGFILLGQSVQFLLGFLTLFYFIANAGFIHTALDAWIWHLEPPDDWDRTEQFFHGLWMALIILLADSPLFVLALFVNEFPILLIALLFYIPINGLIAYKMADYYMIERIARNSPSFVWNPSNSKFERVNEENSEPFRLPLEKETDSPSVVWNASEGKFERVEQVRPTAFGLPLEDEK